jgi:hypothetical protein
MPLIDKVWYELELRDEAYVAAMKRDAASLQQFDQGASKSGATVGRLENGVRAAARAVNEHAAATVAGTRGMSAWSAIHAEAAGHVGEHTLGLSRLERALEEFAAHATGTNRVLALLASTMTRFSLGSIETVGILAGIAAIAAIYEKMGESAKKAKEENDRLIASLEKNLHTKALGPGAELQDQIKALMAELATAVQRRNVAQTDVSGVVFTPEKGFVNTKVVEADEEIFRLTSLITRAERELLQARIDAGKPLETVVVHAKNITEEIQRQKEAIQGFKTAIAAASPGADDNLKAEIDRLTDAAERAHVGASEILKLTQQLRAAHSEALAKEGADLSKEMQAELVKTTGLQAAELRDALAKFDEQIRSKIDAGVPVDFQLVAQLRAAKEEAIPLAEAADRLKVSLLEIDHSTSQGFGFMGAMKTLLNQLDSANADFDTAKATGNVRGMADAEQRRATILARIKQLQDQIAVIIARQADDTDSLLGKVQSVAGGIAAIANAAFGLSAAFAGSNAELTRMLGSIGQAAGGVESLLKAANTKDANGNAPGLGGLLSSASGLLQAAPAIGQIIGGAIGLASTLFGKSPEEAARLQALKENNNRLRELSQNVGDLGRINVTGTQLGTLARFFARPELTTAAKTPAVLADTVNRIIGTALDAVGLSAAEFKDIMRSFGLSIDDAAKITVADVEALKKAIQASELSQFADTFEGQMSQFNAAVKIFDLSKPIDQFNALRQSVGRISGGGGALRSYDRTGHRAGPESARGSVQSATEPDP